MLLRTLATLPLLSAPSLDANDGYRELQHGWGLEEQRWGQDLEAARGRVTLTCLAFNTAQVYRREAGKRLAQTGIRRLRRQGPRELDAAAVVVHVAGG